MDGKGRGPGVLAVASIDPVLSVLGPIGLAAAAGTALVIDLGDTLVRSTTRTLAEIAADGPRLAELAPGRTGVAIVGSGGLSLSSAADMVASLSEHWPAVVLRPGPDGWEGPIVPLVALYPGWLAPHHAGAAVWQRVSGGSGRPGPGPVLPVPGRSLIRRVLRGGLPPRGRWLRVWERVWGLPWA